jgi:hypothetical protein
MLDRLAQLPDEALADELWHRMGSLDLTCPHVHGLIRRTNGSSVYAAELQKYLPEVAATKGKRGKRRLAGRSSPTPVTDTNDA